jgi:hypothetical protein
MLEIVRVALDLTTTLARVGPPVLGFAMAIAGFSLRVRLIELYEGGAEDGDLDWAARARRLRRCAEAIFLCGTLCFGGMAVCRAL